MNKKGDLTWDAITVASKIMLPTYVGMFTVVAMNFLFINSDTLAKSPGLNYADSVLSIRGWGLLFCAVAVMMVVSLVRKNRDMFRYALLMAAICMALWSAVMFGAAIWGPASFSAWSWPMFVAAACMATNRSLLKGEL